VEPAEPVGRDVSRYVLNDAERADLGVVLDDVRVETRLRFALKEALYKALDPFERRFIGFLEVEVWPTADGAATFTLHFVPSVGPVVVDGRWQVVEDLLVASVLVVKQGVK